MSFVEIDNLSEPATHIQRMRGGWYKNRIFPYLHYRKEYLVVGTATKLYKWTPDDSNESLLQKIKRRYKRADH